MAILNELVYVGQVATAMSAKKAAHLLPSSFDPGLHILPGFIVLTRWEGDVEASGLRSDGTSRTDSIERLVTFPPSYTMTVLRLCDGKEFPSHAVTIFDR
jgi:hypothetical protein